MYKKIITAFFIGILFSLAGYGQSTYMPNVIPPSPNAATLTKFSDVPVSPYTGTADISIPVYTIQAKGLSVPISLAYHTGGIRLSEEAGWVGLGWALNAGGMISRTINDKDDFGGGYTTDIPQPKGDLKEYQPANGTFGALSGECCALNVNKYIFDFNCSYNVHFYTPGADSVSDFTAAFQPNPQTSADLEPDNYSFNFLGKSGKFIITRDHRVIMEKQDNLKIQLLTPTGFAYYFLITDESGNKFYFNSIEQGGLSSDPSSITSWHLSKIVTQQNDVITFNYTGSGFNSVGSTNTQTYLIDCSGGTLTTGSNSGYSYSNVILSSIDYTSGQVQFTFDSTREDLQGGMKLNKIAVYSKNGTTGNNLTFLKEHDFYYSYFNLGTSSYELERLKLDSITEKSGSTAIKPYIFAYNSAPSAYGEKHAFSIDHWGYYNGAGNTVLIPSMTTSYERAGVTDYVNYNGANREPSFPNMQCFSLQKITYPTGGYSTLSYSANTYDYNRSHYTGYISEHPKLTITALDTVLNLQSTSFGGSTTVSGHIDFSKIYPLIVSGQAGTNATITIAFISTSSSGWPSADRSTFGKLSFNFNGNTTDISETDLTCGGPACSLSYPLAISSASPTAYTWTATFNPAYIPSADFSEIHVTVNFNGFTPVVNSNPTLTAGGLRVNSITDYNTDGSVAKKRSWDYGYGSGAYSNGILMAEPSYTHNEFTPNGDGAECFSFVLFSSSIPGLTSTIGGNIVGYSHVTEYTVNPSSGADNGKTVYSFVNTPDSTIYYGGLRMPGIPNMGNNLDGSLLSKVIYKNTGSAYWKVNETDNYYHTANRAVYYSAKYKSSQLHDAPGGNCLGIVAVPNQSVALFFPSIKSERVLLDSTKNIVYDPADTTKFITSVNKSYYDNPAHYLVTRSKSIDSRGDTHVSKVTYPQDYITSGSYTGNAILDSLISHNMVTEVIEKRDSLYHAGTTTGAVTSATETRYKQLASGSMVEDKIYRLDVPAPVTDFVPVSVSGSTYSQDSRYRQLISFDSYDSANNLSQYTPANELPVSVIWDYRQVLPIAQVKNAAQADVACTSFEAGGTGNWSVSSSVRDSVTAALTGTRSYNLSSGGISKSGLTTATTYIVSYWSTNNAPLAITGTITGYPVQGPTINGWTYYEHHVTGLSSVSISGSGNIDELRLYPVNAQMTSYTYSPLVGVTSSMDAKSEVTYYEYDSLQRLANIRDKDGNIVKHFDYHYQGQ